MDNQPSSNDPSEKDKKTIFPNNFLLMIIIFGVIGLLIMFFLSGGTTAKLDYADLRDLIKQSDPTTNTKMKFSFFNGLVRDNIVRDNIDREYAPIRKTTEEEIHGKKMPVEYSKVEFVRISSDHLTVKIHRRVLKPVDDSEETPSKPVKVQQEPSLVWVRIDDKGENYEGVKHLLRVAKIPYEIIKGHIDVEDKAAKKTYRYSRLSEVVINNYEVTGKVYRIVIDPPDTEKVADEPIDFVVDKGPTEDIGRHLMANLDEHNIHYSYPQGPSAWRSYLPLFLMIGVIILLFFFMMKRLGGAGSPMAFGRSRGKLYAQEDIGVTFEDVAGVDEAREELREVVEFLKTPEKFQSLGGRIPKGVLLVGPPGTGKTLLAKAIAGEAGVPFFGLSGSDFVEMFVGVGAARVRDMFQQAVARAPSIIFIDELDALGKTRGSSVVGGHDEREQTLNAMLVEMDGFESNSGVIVLAATNRPETLDPALMRPGRFDRHVLVDRPDVRGREAILKVHVQNVKLHEFVELREIAGITSGFVGADLANLVNEAALLAARKNKRSVSMNEFNDAVERVTAGLEKPQRIIHEEEKQRVAYHEAGHALVAYSLPNTDPVHKVSIIPRGMAALGYTMQRPQDDRYLMTQAELESRIQVLLAGTITEEIIYTDISTGAQNDLERATDIARSMVMQFGMSRLGRVNYRESNRAAFIASGGESGGGSHSEQTAREIDEEVKYIIDEAIEQVRHILQTRKEALLALAERLLEQEVLDADELQEIIDEATDSPKVVPTTLDTPATGKSSTGKSSTGKSATGKSATGKTSQLDKKDDPPTDKDAKEAN